MDAIADHAGFGNATALRHHFRAWRGTTPNAYRRLFRGDPYAASPPVLAALIPSDRLAPAYSRPDSPSFGNRSVTIPRKLWLTGRKGL